MSLCGILLTGFGTSGGGGDPFPESPTVGLTTDFDVFDRTETASFQVYTAADDSYGDAVSVRALQRVLDKDHGSAGDGGSLAGRRTIWHLRGSDLVGVQPAFACRITSAAGVKWLIESAHYETLSQRWRCVCRREVTTG